MRLVDADKLNIVMMDFDDRPSFMCVLEEDLNDAPTVDAEQVVRCKDCRSAFVNEEHERKPLICGLTRMCGTTDPMWFCADGKRRQED